MKACQLPTAEMMPGLVHVSVDNFSCDLGCVKEHAREHARKYDSDPMLLSWFDRDKGAYSPYGECCAEGMPSWVSYALSRGGNFAIDVNDGDYYFIFRQSHSSES